MFAGRKPPHLFFSTNDGKFVQSLPGDQTPSKVWKTMTAILRKSYKNDSKVAVKRLLAILNEFDNVDAKEDGLRRRMDRIIETKGPKDPKFKELRKRFRNLQKIRKQLVAREDKLRNLKIR